MEKEEANTESQAEKPRIPRLPPPTELNPLLEKLAELETTKTREIVSNALRIKAAPHLMYVATSDQSFFGRRNARGEQMIGPASVESQVRVLFRRMSEAGPLPAYYKTRLNEEGWKYHKKHTESARSRVAFRTGNTDGPAALRLLHWAMIETDDPLPTALNELDIARHDIRLPDERQVEVMDDHRYQQIVTMSTLALCHEIIDTPLKMVANL